MGTSGTKFLHGLIKFLAQRPKSMKLSRAQADRLRTFLSNYVNNRDFRVKVDRNLSSMIADIDIPEDVKRSIVERDSRVPAILHALASEKPPSSENSDAPRVGSIDVISEIEIGFDVEFDPPTAHNPPRLWFASTRPPGSENVLLDDDESVELVRKIKAATESDRKDYLIQLFRLMTGASTDER